jgi:hypothetical protein
MRVRVPVMIISLEESLCESCISQTLDFAVPLPRFESSSTDVQRAKANETGDNLSCNVYECLLS